MGVGIRSSDFRKVYATKKVNNWREEIIKLSEFAKTQPHAAYSAFCHGEVHKFIYLKELKRGVWRDGQNAFFDVRITNTNSASQLNLKTEKVLLRHEIEKKRGYNR